MMSRVLTLLRPRLGQDARLSARRGVTTVIDQGVASLTNFLSGVIVARTCARSELGLYSLGFGAALLLMSAQTYLVSVPYNVYCMRVPAEERAAYTGSVLLHQLAIAAASAVTLAVAALVAAHGAGVPGMAPVLAMLSVAITLMLAREFGRQLLFSRLRFSSALVLDCVVAVLQVGGLLVLAATGRLSARAAFAVTGLACGAAVALGAVMARRLFAFSSRRIASDFRRNWVTGRWALAAGLTSVGSAQLYPWLLALTRGPDEAGILAACTGITNFTNPVVIGLGNLLAPSITHAFAARGIQGLQHVTRSALLAFVVVMSVMCPALFVGGGALLRWVYGPAYAPYGLTVGLLSLGLVADWLSLPAHYALLFMERADITFKANVIQLGVAVSLGFALVARLGATGAALGLILAYALSTAYKWREYRRKIGSVAADVQAVPLPAAETTS
jgi:O-antigen/teichoic acid export membrane protein